MRELVYGFYAKRLLASLDPAQIPRHVGVILDGNRRWAKASGAPKSRGWRAGAQKVGELLGWCDEVGVEVVTLWLLSTDNLNRPASELTPLLRIIEDLVEQVAESGRARLNPVGALDLLPAETARALKDAAARTAGVSGLHVNVAVGYGGRREIADAVRQLAAHVASDHVGVRQTAHALARQCGVTPALPPQRNAAADEHGKAMVRLQALDGAAFDAEFLRHEVGFHRAAIAAVREQLLPAARCAELKAHLSQVLPAFEHHLARTQELERALPAR